MYITVMEDIKFNLFLSLPLFTYFISSFIRILKWQERSCFLNMKSSNTSD